MAIIKLTNEQYFALSAENISMERVTTCMAKKKKKKIECIRGIKKESGLVARVYDLDRYIRRKYYSCVHAHV